MNTQTETQLRRNVGIREGYNQWASTYNTDGNPLIAVEEESKSITKIDFTGKNVVELGCGTGRNIRRMCALGASTITGVDFSAGMLGRAADELGCSVGGDVSTIDGCDTSCCLIQHDLLSGPTPLDDHQYDVVLCSLVLEHIPVAQLPEIFAEFRRLCKPGTGIVQITVQHPYLNYRKVTARFDDPDTGDRIIIGEAPKANVSHYVLAASSAGLDIVDMGEFGPSEELISNLERAEKYRGMLTLLAMTMKNSTTSA